jgi:hypothetical protein
MNVVAGSASTKTHIEHDPNLHVVTSTSEPHNQAAQDISSRSKAFIQIWLKHYFTLKVC